MERPETLAKLRRTPDLSGNRKVVNMKLDTIALALVLIFAVLWLVTFVTGLLAAIPFGILGLIPVAIVLALLVEVIRQRRANTEDDYYDKNVDQ